MRLLLDTHALIWFVQDADRLPKAAKDAVETAAEDLVLVSADKALDAFGVIRLWDAA
jgi:PIN domain nuclease of toxin-antitoxin system